MTVAVAVAVAVAVDVEVAVDVAVEVAVAVAVAVDVLVAVAVAVAVEVGVDVFKEKDKIHVFSAAALGLLSGTFGAIAVSLVWYSLIAVKMAIPARTIVVISIPIVTNLFLFFIFSFPS